MIDNKQLNESELEKVSGGSQEVKFEGNFSKYRSTYTIPVDKYSGVIGEDYFFYHSDYTWLFGTLRNSYESDRGAYTKRKHDVYVKDGGQIQGYYGSTSTLILSDYGTKEISGDEYQIYTKG